jgi:simple sugar transport system substrate-binding protein
MAGSFSVFKGALKDNKGNVVITADKSYAEDAIELESMSYLVEGVVGSTA